MTRNSGKIVLDLFELLHSGLQIYTSVVRNFFRYRSGKHPLLEPPPISWKSWNTDCFFWSIHHFNLYNFLRCTLLMCNTLGSDKNRNQWKNPEPLLFRIASKSLSKLIVIKWLQDKHAFSSVPQVLEDRTGPMGVGRWGVRSHPQAPVVNTLDCVFVIL